MKSLKTSVVSFAIAKLKAKRRSLLAIIAIVAIIGFSMAGCGGGSGDDGGGGNGGGGNGGGGGGGGGTFTLTGIPSQYNGKYAAAACSHAEETLIGYQSINTSNAFPESLSRISNGRVSIPLWILNENATDINNLYIRYSGNETYTSFGVIIYNSADVTELDAVAAVPFNQVTFSNGSATKSCDQGFFINY
jgi:hypothetical protein